jgi:hypothetical protein
VNRNGRPARQADVRDVVPAVVRPTARSRLVALAPEASWQRSALIDVRATVLSGIWLGALVGGVGGRLAMLILRVLSPDSVHGVVSDDGFLIGQVTLSGTYGLIGVGAGVGIIGAVAYRWVDRWLIGPGWFRQVTAALGAGAVVGSMLVHTDGVDFRVLEPRWLAIALFVLLPAVFGFLIGPCQVALTRTDAWPHRGRKRWILPVVSVLLVPPLIVLVAVVTAAMLAAAGIRRQVPGDPFRDNTLVGLVVRGAWLGIAVLGLASLVSDARTILS